MVEPPDSICQTFRVGVPPTQLFVGNQGRKAADIGNDHGAFKMVCQGCDAALRGIPVRLYHGVGRAQEVAHFTVRNKISTENQPSADSPVPQSAADNLFIFIKFAGYQQPDFFSSSLPVSLAIASSSRSSPLYFRMKPKKSRSFHSPEDSDAAGLRSG